MSATSGSGQIFFQKFMTLPHAAGRKNGAVSSEGVVGAARTLRTIVALLDLKEADDRTVAAGS